MDDIGQTDRQADSTSRTVDAVSLGLRSVAIDLHPIAGPPSVLANRAASTRTCRRRQALVQWRVVSMTIRKPDRVEYHGAYTLILPDRPGACGCRLQKTMRRRRSKLCGRTRVDLSPSLPCALICYMHIADPGLLRFRNLTFSAGNRRRKRSPRRPLWGGSLLNRHKVEGRADDEMLPRSRAVARDWEPQERLRRDSGPPVGRFSTPVLRSWRGPCARSAGSHRPACRYWVRGYRISP
ncbi:hypothetical protein K466DRAFT_170329 [Polyporus arcularius HHB13444]|uniref:Uncharacterized protein n=1 Tax=Polyporus arcularius HHB13444 TaxID=1314778 RepID=A0A5C3P9M6_9APHY|nr:hypothetical protein K466DRAFT_170329 [Polyporus arcularius HHB13444]